MKSRYARIGSVSEGTLLSADLISSFEYELRNYMKHCRVARADRKRMTDTLREVRKYENDRIDYDPSELVIELMDHLETFAPPYTTFGANEGDGASFGFWPCLGTDDLPRVNAGDKVPRDLWGEDILIVNDHGNVDCGHVDKRGRFHGFWSCV